MITPLYDSSMKRCLVNARSLKDGAREHGIYTVHQNKWKKLKVGFFVSKCSLLPSIPSFLDMKASEMLAVLFVLVYSRSYTTLAGEVI